MGGAKMRTRFLVVDDLDSKLVLKMWETFWTAFSERSIGTSYVLNRKSDAEASLVASD